MCHREGDLLVKPNYITAVWKEMVGLDSYVMVLLHDI